MGAFLCLMVNEGPGSFLSPALLALAERKQQLQLGTAKPLILMDMDSVKWDSHHTGLSFNFTGTRSVVVSDQTLPTLDAVSTTDYTMQNQQQRRFMHTGFFQGYCTVVCHPY